MNVSEIRIRQPEPDELVEVGELTVAAYLADGYLDSQHRYATELRSAADRAEHAELLVAVDGVGALLGSVTVVRPGTKYAELSLDGELEFRMLAVSESARGRGVGETLTHAVLDRARELGRSRVVLCSLERMRPAHRLYERVGFTRMPDRDWEPEPGVPLLAYGMEL